MPPLPVETLTSRALRWLALYHRIRSRWRRRARRQASDSRRSDFYRSVWSQAAAAVGASITYLDESSAEIRYAQSVLRVRNNITSLDDPVTVALAGDKPLVNQLLGERGLPVPRNCVCSFTDVRTGWRFAAALGRPCVVKPAKGTGGGTGITIGVSSIGGLVDAMARAGSYCDDLIIEEQVPGENYRLLYLDGELLDALHRRPPTVRGDGKSSVGQLIEAENEDRTRRGIGMWQSLLGIDRELTQTLRDAGHDVSWVPPAGELVRLGSVVSQDGRQDNISVTDAVCQAVVESGAMAAAAVGVRLAGVDIITSDPTVPLGEAGGAIIEVNTGPGLHYHYMTSGEASPVALLILRRLCAAAH